MAAVPLGAGFPYVQSPPYNPAAGTAYAQGSINLQGDRENRQLQDALARRQQEAENARAGMAQEGENFRAGISAETQRLPELNRQNRFNAIFPLLQGAFQAGGGTGAPGGYVSPAPGISSYNPWNQTLTNQAVNSARAFNDKTTGTRLKQMTQSLGARGYAPNSPLALALGSQARSAGLANSMNQVRGIRNDYAQRGADQQNRLDQLRTQQWGMGEEFDIKRKTPVQGQLLSALSNLI